MGGSLLSKWIQRARSDLQVSSHGEELLELRSLVQLAWTLRKNREFLTDPHERSIAFLTERFLLAVHGNLFMDTPFSEDLRKARSHLLGIIGTSLEKMATGLNDPNQEEVYEALSEAVNAYLKTIEHLNALSEKNPSAGHGDEA